MAALVVVVLSAAEASADRPQKKARDARPTTRIVSASFADLPREDLPAMLDDAKAPAEVKQGQPDLADLKLLAATPSDQGKVKKRKTERRSPSDTSEGFSVKLELTSGLISARRKNNGYGQTSRLWTTCGVSRSGYNSRPFAIRWEVAKVSKTALELSVSDGWYDPHTCEISEVRRTVLHPRVIATVNDAPAVWALRSTQEEITVLLPWTSLMSVDGGVTAPKIDVGLLTRVSLPAKRGTAGSLAASYANDYSFRQWNQAVATGGLAGATAALQTASLAVDVVQTVSDATPSITVRVSGENADIRGDAFFER
jgi:hypothetical protein